MDLRKALLVIPFLIGFGSLYGQLSTTPGTTPTDLANVLSGPGVVILNAEWTLPYPDAAGTFNGVTSNLGLNSGVILASGPISNAEGPNDETGVTGENGMANPGDSLLETVSNINTFDACVLEFDIVPSCDEIGIRFVFASDEYPEYTCGFINDAFGFFVTGPGIVGAQNVALVPGTTIPVAIDNVHDGSNPGCPAQNAGFYVNNGEGMTPAANPGVQYDGFTIPIDARISVTPCDTYHIKFVIADGSDDIIDSGVFIEEGGVRCTGLPVNVVGSSVTEPTFDAAVEGCVDGQFTFIRQGDLSIPFTIEYVISGSAQMGTDYLNVSNSITFPIGEDSVSLVISPIPDGIDEGVEEVIIIVDDTVCGQVIKDTSILRISDFPTIDFEHEGFCANLPTQFSDLSQFDAGGIVSWYWEFGDGQVGVFANPTHVYTAPGIYEVTLHVTTRGGCQDSAKKTIEINHSPVPDFSITSVCYEEECEFTDLSTPPPGGIIADWELHFGDGDTAFSPENHLYDTAGTFTLTLYVESNLGCRDTLEQDVTVYPLPEVSFGADTACRTHPTHFTDLSTVLTGPGFLNEWNYHLLENDSSDLQNPEFTFPEHGEMLVELEGWTDHGCYGSFSKMVVVNPLPEPNFGSDIVCRGQKTSLLDSSTIPYDTITQWLWDFNDGFFSTDQSPEYEFQTMGWHNVTLTNTSNNGCSDSVLKKVWVRIVTEKPEITNPIVCRGYETSILAEAPEGFTTWWYEPDPLEQVYHIGDSLYLGRVYTSRQFLVRLRDHENCYGPYVRVTGGAYPITPFSILQSKENVEIPFSSVEFWVDNPDGIQSYEWFFGDGGTSTNSSPVYAYPRSGIYDVGLSSVDTNGCVRNISLENAVKVTKKVSLHIPSAFSPNGDGLNDYFHIQSVLIRKLNFKVFDRWGKMVYETNNPDFRWNGFFGDRNLQEGVYLYVCNAIDLDGVPVLRTGSITLIR